MKKIAIISLVLLLVGFSATAAEFAVPQNKTDANLTFATGEQHKNLYAAGGNVTVNSDITGDLYLAGGMITVNGKVEEDLVLAGGNINLNGIVGDDLRVAGGNISINSPVGGDLLAGGGNLNLTEKSSVGGDAVIGGGNVILDSAVAGNVKIAGGNVTINSKISGTVEVMADTALIFGPRSDVAGRIVYKGPVAAVVQDGAKISTIEFTEIKRKNFGHELAALITVASIIKLLALFLAAWVVNRLFPGKFQALANHAFSRPWHNLGVGAIALVATPLLALLLFMTILGFYLSLVLLALYLLVLLITALVAPYFLGAALIAKYRNATTLHLGWEELLLGLLVMTIVGWIPFIGWLAVGIVFVTTLGAVVAHVIKNETTITL